MRTHPMLYAIGCVFCVTPDAQGVDTCLNRQLDKAHSIGQEKREMATTGDPENACKGWVRDPMEGGGDSARTHCVPRFALVYRSGATVRTMWNYATTRRIARPRARRRR